MKILCLPTGKIMNENNLLLDNLIQKTIEIVTIVCFLAGKVLCCITKLVEQKQW